MQKKYFLLLAILLLPLVSAETTTADYAQTFLWIAIILIIAKFSSLVERFKQPAVLGELIAGVILGNLALLGITIFTPIGQNEFITFLAELGVVILLFQIGLESNMEDMKKVGIRATLVACVGVAVPFALGTAVIGPWLLPGLPFNAYLFLGAALTATSVSITARVFKDLGKVNTSEAKIVLGAAVIDDVLGLIILAVVSAIASAGTISAMSITWITAKALLFLVGAIIIGQWIAPFIGKLFSKIHTGIGMKFTMAISFGLIFAYLSQLIGLAPIVGAFAAGLVLDPVHFTPFKKSKFVEELSEHSHPEHVSTIIKKHGDKHIEEIIEPIGLFLVPIFFIITGFQVNLSTLFDPKILTVALAITTVAVIGKIVSGTVAGKVKKWIVGWGMVPRGEVGLIFATIGKSAGVVNDQVYSIIVIVIIFTTLLTPPILSYVIRKSEK